MLIIKESSPEDSIRSLQSWGTGCVAAIATLVVAKLKDLLVSIALPRLRCRMPNLTWLEEHVDTLSVQATDAGAAISCPSPARSERVQLGQRVIATATTTAVDVSAAVTSSRPQASTGTGQGAAAKVLTAKVLSPPPPNPPPRSRSAVRSVARERVCKRCDGPLAARKKETTDDGEIYLRCRNCRARYSVEDFK